MSPLAPAKKILGIPSRTLVRIGLVVVALTSAAWLAVWLAERSLTSPAKKRAAQSWLDDNLNADVLLDGSMQVRLNLARSSRVMFNGVEIEHPNPVFLGKFALIGAMGAWSPPWAVARLWPDTLVLLFRRLRLFLEENESGEWNIDGLMRPLAAGENEFPFPVPKISDWLASFDDSRVSVKRNGYELVLDLLAEISGTPLAENVTLRMKRTSFSFSHMEEKREKTGRIGPGSVAMRFGNDARSSWFLTPGQCEVDVEDLPAEIASFLVPGIPLERIPGVFGGKISVRETGDAAGMLQLDGELRDVPLAVFGLPRNAPIGLTWPISPLRDGAEANMRMGPSGFGAFTMAIPLDAEGRPKMLSMRGDVAALDDLPALLAGHSRWLDWLSRNFPYIEWRAGKWLGFGWSGDDMLLNLSRSTANLNLTGEASLMGGRLRIALTPGRDGSPVAIAAERLDAQAFVAKLCQSLPASFRANVSGANANVTWQGRRSESGEFAEWSGGMVFAKPVLDLRGGGEWWRCLKNIGRAAASALPEWGGGDGTGLLELVERDDIVLDQLSLVMEKSVDGLVSVEFRAYGDAPGQVTGWIESHPDGYMEGEIFLAGDSDFLREVGDVNRSLGDALGVLADDSLGLRVVFHISPGEEPVFRFPFLEEAKLVHRVLEEGGEDGSAEKDGKNAP